jgi:vacuolar-type H+-ATPase subunit I/STV1
MITGGRRTLRMWSFRKPEKIRNTTKYRANTFGFYTINGNSVIRFYENSRKEKVAGSILERHSRYTQIIEQYLFSLIFGLILIGIGIESNAGNSHYIVKVASSLIAQQTYVMIIAGILVIIVGFLITTVQYLRLARTLAPDTGKVSTGA